MKTCLLFGLTFLCIDLALTQNVWMGGAPGHPTEWENPRNWSLNCVPDWSRHVIIPDVAMRGDHYPEISSIVEEIPSLEICSGAKVHIQKYGVLTVDGAGTSNYGIVLFGEIENKGKIQVYNTQLDPMVRFRKRAGHLGHIEIGIERTAVAKLGGGL